MQLKQLYATTRPLIEELYMRIICEFAINELHEHHVEENAKVMAIYFLPMFVYLQLPFNNTSYHRQKNVTSCCQNTYM